VLHPRVGDEPLELVGVACDGDSVGDIVGEPIRSRCRCGARLVCEQLPPRPCSSAGPMATIRSLLRAPARCSLAASASATEDLPVPRGPTRSTNVAGAKGLIRPARAATSSSISATGPQQPAGQGAAVARGFHRAVAMLRRLWAQAMWLPVLESTC
jgi:hypothetical protein